MISHVTGVTLKRLLKVEILKLKQEDSTSRVQHVLGLGCARALQVRGHRLHMCDRDLTGLILNSEVYW